MEDEALLPLAWSRVFSSVVDEGLREEAWHELDLPLPFGEMQPHFYRTFHLGLPQPAVPLLMHVLLQRDGGGLREEMVHIIEYLELDWSDVRLPPDHLACVLEIYALALAEDEAILVQGLHDRYLEPWMDRALAQTADEPALLLLRRLREDLVEKVGSE